MTDQGALERARGIVSLVLHKQWLFVNMSGSDGGLYGDREAVAREIAAALKSERDAAASEARAAAIEPLRPHLIARVERYGHTDGKFAFWGYHCKACKSDWAKDAPEQHHAECALATPAQSETL